jgi:hypothetical protein
LQIDFENDLQSGFQFFGDFSEDENFDFIGNMRKCQSKKQKRKKRVLTCTFCGFENPKSNKTDFCYNCGEFLEIIDLEEDF